MGVLNKDELIAGGWDAVAALRGVGYTPQNLDVSGVTDSSAALLNAFAISKFVRLPVGIIKADFTLPSGCTLIGAGQLAWDRTSAWTGTGTLLLGRIIVTGSNNWQVSDLAIDNFTSGNDAIDGKSDATQNGAIRRVSTRANNHNILLEKNANTGVPGTDAIGATVNNILIEDCSFNGGPNGIAIKMRGVTVRRCTAYDITVQAFVAVSDTINGVGSYSRGRDILFQDCVGISCGSIFRNYSRDNNSTTNTGGVLGTLNVRWIGGRLVGATNSHGAEIGDPNNNDATLTRVKCIDTWVIGADVRDNSQAGIFFECSTGGGYDECYFDNNGTAGGGNANVGVQTSNAVLPVGGNAVDNLTHGKNNSNSSNAAGYEVGQKSRQATATLTSSQKGIAQTNYLATGAIVLTLPAPQEGDEYEFISVNSQSISFVSAVPATNRIRDGSLLAAGAVASTVPGSVFRVKAVRHNSGNLEWFCITNRGTWTGLA